MSLYSLCQPGQDADLPGGGARDPFDFTLFVTPFVVLRIIKVYLQVMRSITYLEGRSLVKG